MEKRERKNHYDWLNQVRIMGGEARLGFVRDVRAVRLSEPGRVSEKGPSCPNLSDCPSLSGRFLGVCPTESRAETILSEPSLGCPIVQCPNADP